MKRQGARRDGRTLSGYPFLKVDGAGNDFVLVDARGETIPRPSRAAVRRLLDRHRGVGGDGLLLICDDPVSGVPRVRFQNPDGGVATFCGNGARCVGLVLLQKTRRDSVAFRLGRIQVIARRSRPGRVRVRVPNPRPLPLPEGWPPISDSELASRPEAAPGSGRRRPVRTVRAREAGAPPPAGGWYDTGVPHWIVPVTAIDTLDLAALARPLRAWPALGAGGTNVDAVEVRDGVVHVRTWERGVEGETLACGSGLVAAGHWAATACGVPLPVNLVTVGGDRLVLEADPGGRHLWLEGPARVVFEGRLAAERSKR